MQAAAAAVVRRQGQEDRWVRRASGRATSDDAKLMAIRLGLGRCFEDDDLTMSKIVVFSDSLNAIRLALDASLHSF